MSIIVIRSLHEQEGCRVHYVCAGLIEDLEV